MRTTTCRIAIASVLLLSVPVQLAFTASESVLSQEKEQVTRLVERFLQAFEKLDMANFIRCFADDATVYFPQPEPAGRFDGKEAIKTHFEQVFAAIRRTSTRSTPPFHRLIPEDLRVQLLGDSSAVVTFRLSNADRIARRTLVLEKLGNAWFIVHVHASNVPVLRQSPAPKTVKPAQAHEERTPN
jgi:uncharacterized protein (TIGR02246 family)